LLFKALENVTEEQAKVIPTNFNNNILWNVGHIYVSFEHIVLGSVGKAQKIDWADLFVPGSKPAEWTKEAPTLEELKGLLQEQTSRVAEVLEGHLDDQAENPFKLGELATFTTARECISFSLFHEGLHVGTINNLKKLV
jgi:hypothetical protein